MNRHFLKGLILWQLGESNICAVIAARKITYKIQSRGNKVHHIYESVNGGKWSQVGVVDWKYQRPSDLGTNETGGPIFAEIMQTAISRR